MLFLSRTIHRASKVVVAFRVLTTLRISAPGPTSTLVLASWSKSTESAEKAQSKTSQHRWSGLAFFLLLSLGQHFSCRVETFATPGSKLTWVPSLPTVQTRTELARVWVAAAEDPRICEGE